MKKIKTNNGPHLSNLSLKVFVFLLFTTQAFAVPIITNVEPTSISDTSMVITWSTTNEAAGTEILWGAGGLTNVTTVAGTTKYHKIELTGLYQNTTYQYRIRSGSAVFPPSPLFSPLSFTTLERPSGEYLFSFAVLSDLRYAEGKASVSGSRGIPYALSSQILNSEVSDINNYTDPNGRKGPAFTVINGNIVDSSGSYGDQGGTNVKTRLDALNNIPSDLTSPIAYKYLPVTGYHDKKATYTTDWITNAFNPLTSSTSIESVYGYNAASKDADSVFNYQFTYNHYNFVFLDAVKRPADATGSVDLTTLYTNINSEAKKTFIFMSYPAYNPFATATKDYPLDIPTAEVGGALYIDNHAAFRATLESFTDTTGNPLVAAVISGHLGDNYKRDIPLTNDSTKSISYVRQGPALQYPTGYSIYKVYSTGYIKTFYKTTGGQADSGDTKPYFEYARDQISAETVSSQLVGKDVLTQFWLGSSSNRNFTYTYAFIPGLGPRVISTGPASNESAVSLNAPVLINFNKRLASPSNLNEWVTIKDADNNAVAVSAASFIDASRTILKVTHADLAADKTYTVTVDGSKVIDEGSTAMGSNYSFSFNTNGGTKDDSPPSAVITPLLDNATTDPFPNFTGVATDDSRVIVVQYRFDNTGSWTTTEAVDGEFTGSTEVFQIKPSTALSTGSHQVWLKTSDAIGNTSAEGFMAYAFNVLTGDKPIMARFKTNANTTYPGDSIDAHAKIEVNLSSYSSLESGRLILDGVAHSLSFIKVDTNYYATYEVTGTFSDGIHGITVEAFDVNGNGMTYEVYPLYVRSASDTAVQSTPLSFPNPFDPGTQTTALSYTLTKNSDITLSFHDLSGTTIAKKSYTSGDNGGRAGYNEVTWDGKSDTGSYVGNGIYIYLIIGDGKVLSKGKVTVVKR